MIRLIHFFARLYPRSWRQRYGAEFDALLEEVRPDGRALANVLTGALAMHIRVWKSWKIFALAVLVGAAVIAGLFAAIPNDYVSRAIVKIDGDADWHTRIDEINTIAQSVESRGRLMQVIAAHGLYERERSSMPADDVIEEMKRNIIIAPLGGQNLPAFSITFHYRDPRQAQQVTEDITSQFLAGNVHSQGIDLQILDPADLPQASVRSNPAILGIGFASFLAMWGALAVWRAIAARRYATAGASISAGGTAGGSVDGGAAVLSLPPFREHLRRNAWKILAAFALLIAVAALAFRLANPNLYESVAFMKTPQADPQAIADLAQSVESRASLTRIITTYNLYPTERSRMPMDDVIEQMKRNIRIGPLGENAAAVIGFTYSDRFLAQRVADALMSQSVSESVGANGSASFAVLDRASLPPPTGFDLDPRFTVGLVIGLLLGVIFAMTAMLFRRSPTPV
jgi:capsular polysaccharide biosynthesis protein